MRAFWFLLVGVAACSITDNTADGSGGDGGTTADAAPRPRPITVPLQGPGFHGAPSPVVGTPFTGQVPIEGGTPPYTAKLKPGSSLPDGLSFDAAGRFTGTPTTAGSYDFSFTVEDSAGASFTAELTFTILASGTPPSFLVEAKPAPMFGQDEPVGYRLMAWGSGAPWTFSVTGLPPGLTFDPATGTISGKTSVTGNASLSITATDASGKAASGSPATLALSVSPPILPTPGVENWTIQLPSAPGTMTTTKVTVHGGAISQVPGTEWMWKNPAGDCSYAVSFSGQVAGDQWSLSGETVGQCNGQMTQCFGQGQVTTPGTATGMLTCNTTYPSLPADSNTGPWTATLQP